MKTIFLSILLGLCVSPCLAGSMTWISYEKTEEFGIGRWEYTYEVANIDLSVDGVPAAIKEFTIWFDPGLYANLVITTPAALSNSWNQIIWQPEPVLYDAGGFDGLAIGSNSGIAPGQSVKGFSVAFNWLGQGSPGAQDYEIINPLTFKTIEPGTTIIPEPVTILLLGLGGFFVQKRKK
jgi:hypothetical protein